MLVAVTWGCCYSTDVPSLCSAAVALKNHGAEGAERDGDHDSRPALGTAAVPEGELLLQVSGPLWPPLPGRCLQELFPWVLLPLRFAKRAGCSVLSCRTFW